jgi:plastocyanin
MHGHCQRLSGLALALSAAVLALAVAVGPALATNAHRRPLAGVAAAGSFSAPVRAARRRVGLATATVPKTSARNRLRHRSRARPVARAAGDPAVTIADFHFTPGATTVHVGETVTWTNDGPSSHTATARNGGFDTGVLAKGASASHTFTQPGTYTYYCKIHPFMHGTIVVLASNSPGTTPKASTPAPSATTPASSSTTPTGSSSGPAAGSSRAATPTLPVTGMNVLSGVLAGLALLGLGLALRRVLRLRRA